MPANQAASDVGQEAQKMANGYYVYLAALAIASDPKSDLLVPATLPGHTVPIGTVVRKDGTAHAYHFRHYLEQIRSDPSLEEEFSKMWLVGSILTLGELLAAHSYFDHAPELELIYHLRNGIAHGNRFHLTQSGLSRLSHYPAHNKLALVRGDGKEEFEITPRLQRKQVLYDFMGPGNVLDLLMSVSVYLIRMGNGDPSRP